MVALIGGGGVPDKALAACLSHARRIVAADGGAAALLAVGRMPDLVIGDLDSLAPGTVPAARVLHDPDQDSTDFEKCLSRIEADLVLATGFLGGRMDHALAAMTVLARRVGPPCIVLGDEDAVLALPEAFEVDLPAGTRVSLFPMGPARVRSEGLEWPTDGLDLAPAGRVGTSNRALGPVRLRTEGPVLLLAPPAHLGALVAGLGAALAPGAAPRYARPHDQEAAALPKETAPQDDALKRAAARRAVRMVEDGMRLGLGTGSTAEWAVRLLGRQVREEGLDVTAVPTSRRTAELARAEGLRLVALDEVDGLDLTIDGADEIGPGLALVKGAGGALLIEKIVASASSRMVVIAHEAKVVGRLGARPLPVEVVPFAWRTARRMIAEALGRPDLDARLRAGPEGPFVTDEGNHILDLALGRIEDPWQVSLLLNQVPGVVENGLFIDIAFSALVARAHGGIDVIARDGAITREGPPPAEDNVFLDVTD